jgi:periplasmic nitrate reductase NapD
MQTAGELHISSLVVHAAPVRLGELSNALAGMAGVQVHATSPEGKLVVTLERPSADSMTDSVAAIQRMTGVFSAALVYQCADTLEAMNEEMNEVSPDAQA